MKRASRESSPFSHLEKTPGFNHDLRPCTHCPLGSDEFSCIPPFVDEAFDELDNFHDHQETFEDTPPPPVVTNRFYKEFLKRYKAKADEHFELYGCRDECGMEIPSLTDNVEENFDIVSKYLFKFIYQNTCRYENEWGTGDDNNEGGTVEWTDGPETFNLIEFDDWMREMDEMDKNKIKDWMGEMDEMDKNK